MSEDNLLDVPTIYYLTTTEANLPLSVLDRFTFNDLMKVLDLKIENEKTHYNLLALSVQVGYVNANSKKKVSVFKDTNENNNKRGKESKKQAISKEEKESTLDFLDSLF